jgi:crotonobetainyl-CoA:carnitine CoA-transferase CaiB-like acyl-CoA transferase
MARPAGSWPENRRFLDGSRDGREIRLAMEQKLASWIRERDDPKIASTKPEALHDITVLDLSYKSYAGCYCSSMLSEFGAKVIRIEPAAGDFLRTCTPYGLLHQGEGLNYLTEGRNKYHITLNLEKPKAREILKSFARHADVLIETYKPGTMDEWGVGYEQLKEINPRLIFASITAFGQFGSRNGSKMPDYDNIIQARSAIQYASGEVLPDGKNYDDCPYAVPTKVGPWMGWVPAGTFMAAGILAALYWRGMTGEGQALDVATAEAYSCFDDYAALWYQEEGRVNERFGSLDVAGWLYCFAPTKDGAVFLGGLRLEMWQAFVDMIGKWDEWGAASWKNLSNFMRQEEQLKWAPLVFAETRKYTNAELVAMSVKYTKEGRLAPIAPVVAPVVSPDETMKDANWIDRGLFTPIKDPVYGEVVVAQAQHKMTETPIRTKWICRPIGYDNEYIYLRYLSLGPARLKRLKQENVI